MSAGRRRLVGGFEVAEVGHELVEGGAHLHAAMDTQAQQGAVGDALDGARWLVHQRAAAAAGFAHRVAIGHVGRKVARVGVDQEHQPVLSRHAGFVRAHVIVVGVVFRERQRRVDRGRDLVGQKAHVRGDRWNRHVLAGVELNDQRAPEQIAAGAAFAADLDGLARVRLGVQGGVSAHPVQRRHALERDHRWVEHGGVLQGLVCAGLVVGAGLCVAIGGETTAAVDRLAFFLRRLLRWLRENLGAVGERRRVLTFAGLGAKDRGHAGVGRFVTGRRCQVAVQHCARAVDRLGVLRPRGVRGEAERGDHASDGQRASRRAGLGSHRLIVALRSRHARAQYLLYSA